LMTWFAMISLFIIIKKSAGSGDLVV